MPTWDDANYFSIEFLARWLPFSLCWWESLRWNRKVVRIVTYFYGLWGFLAMAVLALLVEMAVVSKTWGAGVTAETAIECINSSCAPVAAPQSECGRTLALCLVLFKHSSRSLTCERDPQLEVTPFPHVSPARRVMVKHYLVILPIPFCSYNSSIILLEHKFSELPPFKFLE